MFGRSEPGGDQPAGRNRRNIYGNIELQSDADMINVQIRRDAVQRHRQLGLHAGWRPDELALDVAAQNDCGVGTLNINSGGNLHW